MNRKKSIAILLLFVILFQILVAILVAKNELNDFYADSKYQSEQVEKNVQVTINFVEYMKILAEQHYSGEYDGEYALYDELVYDSENNLYYVDESYNGLDYVGTTVGLGEIPVSEETIEELDLSYKFMEFFVDFYEDMGNIAWVYYISASGFVSLYPHVPPTEVGNPLDFHSKQYYVDVLPENNPEGNIVWSEVYVDAWGMGEVITLSVPIYGGDEFKGVLAVDRTVGDIKAILKASWDSYILSAKGDLITSNTTLSGSSKNDSCVTQEELQIIQDNSATNEDEIEYADKNFVYVNSIDDSDWMYTAVLPAREIFITAFVTSSPIMIITLIGIFVYLYYQRHKAQRKLQEQNIYLEEIISERTKEIRLTQEITIEAVSSLTESRDNETGNHILRTKIYTRILAEELSKIDKYHQILTKEKIHDISMSAPLHDIGKVGIRDDILLKPGKLTDEEFLEMKKHTTIGADVLTKAVAKIGKSSFLDNATEMARSHHERWDGKGYPNGLYGELIPLSARIMSVADVYDALRSQRVYKPAMPHEKALDIILSEAGKAFDPDVVEAFESVNKQFEEISEKYRDM